MKWIIASCIGLLLLASCSPEAQSYSDVDALAADLSEAGVACAEERDLPDAQLVEAGVECDSEGSRLSLRLFADEEARDDWMAFGKITGESLVVGPNWIVSTTDVRRAEEVHDALGGEIDPSD